MTLWPFDFVDMQLEEQKNLKGILTPDAIFRNGDLSTIKPNQQQFLTQLMFEENRFGKLHQMTRGR